MGNNSIGLSFPVLKEEIEPPDVLCFHYPFTIHNSQLPIEGGSYGELKNLLLITVSFVKRFG